VKTGGHSVGDRRQGDRQQDIIRNGCDFLPKKRSLVLLQEDRYQEDRRQECGQAGRRQSGDRRTDRQATDRQATSVNFKVLCRREGGGSGLGCIVLILLACRRARSAGPGQHVGLAVLECWELEAGILRMRVFSL
jgi:hypothetical protein